MRFDWVRIDSFALYTTISTSHDVLIFYYRGRAVWTEIRISHILSWKDEVSPQYWSPSSLAFHMVSRHVRLLQQVVAWSLLIDGRIYVNFAKSHNPITFIIYLLTLSWIFWSPRKVTKFLSDAIQHRLEICCQWVEVSRRVRILILVYDTGFIRLVIFFAPAREAARKLFASDDNCLLSVMDSGNYEDVFPGWSISTDVRLEVPLTRFGNAVSFPFKITKTFTH